MILATKRFFSLIGNLLLLAAMLLFLSAGNASAQTSPIAEAGPDLTLRTGVQGVLDGSASFTNESQLTSFIWSIIDVDAPVTLFDADQPQSRIVLQDAGTYEIALTVRTADGGSATDTLLVTSGLQQPIASAGLDRTVTLNQTVVLDASQSYDPDGMPLKPLWNLVSMPDGALAELSDPTAFRPSFTPDLDGTYVFELTTTNMLMQTSAPDRITLSTTNSSPTVSLGADVAAVTGARVTLDPLMTLDPDGDVLAADWTLVYAPTGSQASVSEDAGGRFGLTPDVDGHYIVRLTADDGVNAPVSDQLVVFATSGGQANVAPMAVVDFTAQFDGMLRLNGTGSTDLNGDALSYQWSLLKTPPMSFVSLTDADKPVASLQTTVAGLYIIQLKVEDGRGGVSYANIVYGDARTAPQAIAGSEVSITDLSATVDGSETLARNPATATLLWSYLGLSAGEGEVQSPNQAITDVTFATGSTGVFDNPKVIAGLRVLEDYSLFTRGRHTAQGRVEGRALIGGSSKGGRSKYGTGLGDTAGVDVLTVRDGIKGGWRFVAGGGNIKAGGRIRSHLYFEDQGRFIRDNQVSVSAESAGIKMLSAELCDLAANSDYAWVGHRRYGTISLPAQPGADGVAVFHFENGASLLNNSSVRRINLEANGAESIIINVSGRHLNVNKPTLGGDFLAPEIARKVIWNFHGATHLNIHRSLRGAVLAPYAKTNLKAHQYGPVATGSLVQHADIKLPNFDGSALIGSDDDVSNVKLAVLQLAVDNGAGLAPSYASTLATVGNLRPRANVFASPAQAVLSPGETVSLSGLASTDDGNATLTYRWSRLFGPSDLDASLAAQQGAPQIDFDVTAPGQYVFQLVVSDGALDSAPKTISFTVANQKPVAVAGADQTGPKGQDFILDGSASSDPDGDTLTYRWAFTERPADSEAVLTDAQTVRPSFTADAPGTYRISLIVNDGTEDSATDTLTVTADNLPPVAVVTGQDSGFVDDMIMLSGLQSSDPDGDALTYQWSLQGPDGSMATISTPAAADTMFTPDVSGTYTVSLIVSDGFDASVPANFDVAVSGANRPPVLTAIGPKSVPLGSAVSVQLVASDPDGDSFEFFISNLPLPNGASFNVESGLFTIQPGVDLGQNASFTFGVTDGILSDTETVAFTVTNDNASDTTDYTGTIIDSTSGSPIAGVTVRVGDVTAVTNAAGQFTLTGLAPGQTVFWIVTNADTQVSADGTPYAATQVSAVLIEDVINRAPSPIRLSTLSGSTVVTPDAVATVTDSRFGATLEIPAGALTTRGTDTPYDGPVSLAGLTAAQSNVLPPNIEPCQIFAVEPKTLQIAQPVTLSVANYDNLPAGVRVDVWVFSEGRFTKRGVGTVAADGARVTTSLRNIPGGALITLVPRPGTASVSLDQPKNTYVPSLLGEGNFSTSLDLPGYASQGAQRGLSFVYNSTAAAPSPIISASVDIGMTVPVSLSTRVEVGGVDYSQDVTVSTEGGDTALQTGETIRQAVQIDASNLPVGVNDFDFVSVSEYACSKVGQATAGQVYVDNQTESEFGRGWSLAELTRLYPQPDGGVLIREGNGTLKSFESQTDFSTLGDPVRLPANGPGRGEPTDLDGDGDDDIAWVNNKDGAIELYENLGERNFVSRIQLKLGNVLPADSDGNFTPDITNIATGDIDGDGLIDIAAGLQQTDGLYVFFGTGSFTFEPVRRFDTTDYRSIVIEDFNNDGFDDIIAFQARGTFAETPDYYIGSSGRTLRQVSLSGSARGIIGSAALDFNKDGLSDVVSRGSGGVAFWRGREGRTPQRGGTYDGSFSPFLGQYLDVDDLDGDGFPEVVVSGTEGFTIISSTGRNTYQIEKVVNTAPGAVGNRTFAIADLNRDGLGDIITNAGTNIVTFFGDPDTLVSEPEVVDVGFSAQDQQVTDLDGDGGIDVIVDDFDANEILVFFSDPSRTSKFIDPLADYTELTRNEDGSYTRRYNDGTVLAYNPAGLQTSVTDSNGNVTAYTYDAQDRLLTITDPVGLVTNFTYGALGRVSRIDYPDGRSATWEYNAKGELLRSTNTNGDVMSYGYDAASRLTAKTDPRGLVTDVQYGLSGRYAGSTLPDGTELKLEIARTAGLAELGGGTFTPGSAGVTRLQDGRGNITETQINDFGSPILVMDPLDRETRYTRDGDNNVIVIDAPSAVTADGRLRTEIDYDSRGNVIAKREAVGTPLERSMTYEYEPEFNKMIRMVDADGFETTRTYDAFGNMLSQTDPEGGVMQMTYDVQGLPASRTDKNGNLTRLFYDGRALPITMTDPSGIETEYRYDDKGNLVSQIDDFAGDLERETTYTYDDKNRLLTETAADGGVTTYTYDGNDNVLTTTDPTGIVETRSYDDRDRLITINDPASGTTVMTYDADSNLTRMTDAAGETTEFSYDAVDRLLSSVDAKGQLRAFAYDVRDNITGVTDARANLTLMSYDALDRPIGRTNPVGEAYNFAYDLRDNRTSATKPDGVVITSAYDGLGRLTAIAGGDVSRAYAYDAQSNLLSANDNFAGTDPIALSFGYDGENRNTSSVVTGLFGPAGEGTHRFDYAYDNLDRRAILSDGFGGNTRYAYDPVDRLAELTTPGGELFTTSYDLAGRMLGRTAPNVTDLSRGYEAATGRLASQTSALLGEDINAFDYAYTDRGNLSEIGEGGEVTRDRAYTYDELERLVEVDVPTAPSEAESYTLDPEGNRLSSHLSASHETDAANRLQSDDRYSYTYDLNGNLIGKTAKPGTNLPDWGYAYDAMDQLISVSRNGIQTESYRYDAFGRRTRIITSGEAALGLANDGSDRTLDLVVDDNGEATLLRRYTHSDRVDDPLQMEVVSDTGSDVYTYHSDHLGSIRALTDSAGNVSHAYDYDSYGQLKAEVQPTAEAAANPFRYTGREWDAASDLYHYRARQYDASTGRFLQEDPLGFGAEDMNFYRYVGNNPLRFFDPYGFSGAERPATNLVGGKSSAGIAKTGKALNCAFLGIAAALEVSGGGVSLSGALDVADAASECSVKVQFRGKNSSLSKSIRLILGDGKSKPPRLDITLGKLEALFRRIGLKGKKADNDGGTLWFLKDKFVFFTRKGSSEKLPTLDIKGKTGKNLSDAGQNIGEIRLTGN